MESNKRIPDEIFEELCGFTTEEGKPQTNISQKEFDQIYSLKNLNRFRIQNAAEAFMHKILKKLFKLFQKDSIGKNLFTKYKKDRKKISKLEKTLKRKENKVKRLKKIKKWFKKIVSYSKKKISKAFKKLKIIFKNIGKRLKRLFNNILKFFKKHIRPLLNKFKEKFVNAVKKVTKILKTLLGYTKNKAKSFISLIKFLFSNVFSKIKIILNRVKNYAASIIKKYFLKFINFLRPAITKIKKGVRTLLKIGRKFIRPIVGAIKKFGLKAGKSLGKQLGKHVGITALKKAGAWAAKSLARQVVIAKAAGATAATGVGSAIGAGIAIAGSIGNAVWTAWDWYGYWQLGKFAYKVGAAIMDAPKATEDIENTISDMKSEEEIVQKQRILFTQNENLNFENYILTAEKIIKMKAGESRDTQMSIIREKMYEAVRDVESLSPELKELNLNAPNKSLEEIVHQYNELKNKQNGIFNEAELSFMLGSPSGSKILNLMEIWKRVIQFIKNNFWSSIYSENLYALLNQKRATVNIDIIKKDLIDLISRNSFNPYSKFLSKKTFVSTALFELFIKDNKMPHSSLALEMNKKHTIKGENKLSEQEVYSLAKNIMVNPLIAFDPYIEVKRKERDVQTDKISILSELKTVLASA